jgi:hypothetical protein
VKGARGLGPSVALYGTAHHLEQLAGYGGIRLVDHARVALGVAVYQPLLLPDILEGLAQPLPPIDGPALLDLLVAHPRKLRLVAHRRPKSLSKKRRSLVVESPSPRRTQAGPSGPSDLGRC